MKKRETICSQQIHCLSCPLSVMKTGKDCRDYADDSIPDALKYYEAEYRQLKQDYDRLLRENIVLRAAAEARTRIDDMDGEYE